MTRPQCIHENNLKIGLNKRKIIIPSIPNNHLRLSLSYPQHSFVIDACIDRNPCLHEGLEFFSLFKGTGFFLHIPSAGKTEHWLEPAISHRVPDHRNLETFLSQKGG